ncbi:alpha/beta hydrolase [Streptomyces sp. HNM0574]|nr:alpha/beta hydrolase [Streptomyces sp. HNM0574]
MRTAALYGTLGAVALTATTVTGVAPSPAQAAGGRLPDPLPASGAVERALAARGVAEAARDAAAAGIDWRTCPDSEGLPPTVRCGTVTVPLDYTAPRGEKIRLTVSRKQATGPRAERQGPLLHNPGGPGGNGMTFPMFPVVTGKVWKRLNSAYDFVGYAPRGVGRSAPLSCQDPAAFQRGPHRSLRDPGPEFKRKQNQRAAAYARGCARKYGERLSHFTTADNARDLDVLRAALGQRRLNFYGASYGSYLGSVYATLFPGHVRRLVLDSVVDPSEESIWYESNLRQNTAFERRWKDWKRWTAKHRATYRLGSTPRQVQRVFDQARDAADRGRLGRGVGAKELLAGYLDVGYDDSTWARHAAALADFRGGDPTGLRQLLAPDPHSARDEENSNAAYNAVQCADAPWPRDWRSWDEDNTRLARTAPFHTWENAWMNLPCAHWDVDPGHPVDVGAPPGVLPPVLLLSASRDAATPHEGAVATWRRLPGSSLVTERGAGDHGVAGGNRCADRHLERYLLDGTTPGPTATCPARPAPRPEPAGPGAPSGS